MPVSHCPYAVYGQARTVTLKICPRYGLVRSARTISTVSGALDGKHIPIKAPQKSGSMYHNYKGFFSMIPLALADADYKFIWASVAEYGSLSDCQVFNESDRSN